MEPRTKTRTSRLRGTKSRAASILEKIEKLDKLKPNARLKKRIYDALKLEFPDETVDISDGYRDNIHVLVVSRKFDKFSEKKKMAYLWEAITANGVFTDEELAKISLLLAYSPKELK